MSHQNNVPSAMNILIVDDDKKLCRLVADRFTFVPKVPEVLQPIRA